MRRALTVEKKNYEFIVVGGGISGTLAAIAAARQGVHTALINNRPMLGGNASSEIKMHICGASHHDKKDNVRETGILEEILLKNKYRNQTNSFHLFDTIIWETVKAEEKLDLYLNTHISAIEMKEQRIDKIFGIQLTSETEFIFSADNYLDATGDGTLGYLAGAEYMEGRESSAEFGEYFAPDIADDHLMGNSLMFTAIDTGKPVKFIKPSWAYSFTEADLANRNHSQYDSGYWWIEIGGDKKHQTVSNFEQIRDELLKTLYGVWDHIKNQGDHGAENYELDWVQFLPGKRESRRLTGDYVLTANDLLTDTHFDDTVAYGGWPMDMHAVGGMENAEAPTTYHNLNGIYQIPYRCLYSKNIDNLFLGGRSISVSHMSFGSTRVMGTCGIIGEAVGLAAAIAKKYSCVPKEVFQHIKELQQLALKEDLYIPSIKNEDNKDLALKAAVTASSFENGFEPAKVVNGVARTVKEEKNAWKSIGNKNEWLDLRLNRTAIVQQVQIKFDSNLSKEIMPSLSKEINDRQDKKVQKSLVKDFELEFITAGQAVERIQFKDNFLRNVRVKLEQPIKCDQLRINLENTNGCRQIEIFEVRIY